MWSLAWSRCAALHLSSAAKHTRLFPLACPQLAFDENAPSGVGRAILRFSWPRLQAPNKMWIPVWFYISLCAVWLCTVLTPSVSRNTEVSQDASAVPKATLMEWDTEWVRAACLMRHEAQRRRTLEDAPVGISVAQSHSTFSAQSVNVSPMVSFCWNLNSLFWSVGRDAVM